MAWLSKDDDRFSLVSEETQGQSVVRRLHTKLRYAFVGLSLAGMLQFESSTLPKAVVPTDVKNHSRLLPELSAAVQVSNLDTGEYRKLLQIGPLSVLLDSQGVPRGYTFFRQEVSEFDQSQLERLEYARQRAEQSGQQEPAFIISRQVALSGLEATKERPYAVEAPRDILSSEKLQSYGVTLINPVSSETAPLLFLRESLFEGNNMLEPLRLYNQSVTPEEQLSLVLVNFNTEVLARDHFLSLPEYQPYLHMLRESKTDPDKYLRDTVVALDTQIEQLGAALVNNTNQEEVSRVQDKLRQLKAQRLIYLEAIPRSEVVNEALTARNGILALGSYYDQYSVTETETDSVIFVTSPEKKQKDFLDFFTLFVDTAGEISIQRMQYDSRMGATAPTIDRSYPPASELREHYHARVENDEYRYDSSDTIGFVTRHELAHFLLMKVLPALAKKGLIEESKFAQTILEMPEIQTYLQEHGHTAATFPPINNEYITDSVAAKAIEVAHTRWILSDLSDDSGYGLVFHVRDGHQHEKGYQLTEQRSLLKKDEESS